MATAQELITALGNSLSPSVALRKEAEGYLKSLERQQGYALVLLQIADHNDAAAEMRQSAAIAFKNYIRKYWRAITDEPSVIVDEDRERIKSIIVQLMLKTPEMVQRQLSDAISIIGLEDFPKKWPGLLQEMVAYFQSNDFHLINGVLQTAESLFRRYRHECKSQELWLEIKIVLDTLAEPLTTLFTSIMKLMGQSAEKQALKTCFSILLLIIRVYHSLVVQELPDHFADENLKLWMENLQMLMSISKRELDTNDDDEPGLVEQCKAEICSLLSLFAQKYDDDFAQYLPNFVQSTWALLVTVDLRVKYDNLVSNAIDFLAAVAERPAYKELFAEETTLHSICEKVIVPNMQFRGSDEDLFEDNPEEYVRRDLEGSDIGTRRHAACNLVQSLCKFFEAPVTTIFGGYIQVLLGEFAKDPATNWKAKDVVLYLISALAARSKTVKHGATKTSTFVNVGDIFVSQCLPHLQDADVSKHMVLKADCIRYITIFRSVLPRDTLLMCLPLLVHHLQSPSYVVHTYAAHCIEKLLTLRLDGRLVVTASDVQPHFKGLMTGLFGVLRFECSSLNEYAMKAIMRCLSTMKEELISFYSEVLQELVAKLVVVCQNPSRPHFNHYLFESISCIIRHTCEKDPAVVKPMETVILPIIQDILVKDILEFMPYAFQMLSLLIEIGPAPISETYTTIYPTLLTPVLWEQQGNIPALVRLNQAFIQKSPKQVCSGQLLLNLLGVFQKLIASKTNDHEGFYLVNSLIEHGDREAMSNLWKDIFVVLFRRLQSSKTTKFVKGLIVCLCLFAGKFGGEHLMQIVDTIQPKLFAMVLEKVVIPEAQKVSGPTERKITAVGIIKLLTETPSMLAEPYVSLWTLLLRCLISLFEMPEDDSIPDDEHFIDIEDAPGYQTAFAQLAFVGSKEKDPFGTDVPNPKAHLAQSLHKLSSQHPGKLSPLIASGLDAESVKFLQNYLQAANISALI